MEPIRVPKYYQIKKDILEAIKAGELLPGDMIDSAAVLRKKYEVSTITVRKAFDDLINEGYLVGVQGKGTFVAKKGFNRALTSLSFSDELLEQGYKIDLIVDEIGEVYGEYYAQKLGIDKSQPITKVSRVRLGNGEVMAYQTSYIPSSLLSVTKGELIRETKSFYKTIETVGLIPSWAMETYSIKPVKDKHVAKLMNIPETEDTFYVTRITYDSEDNIIEYSESYFNKYTHSISVVIKR